MATMTPHTGELSNPDHRGGPLPLALPSAGAGLLSGGEYMRRSGIRTDFTCIPRLQRGQREAIPDPTSQGTLQKSVRQLK